MPPISNLALLACMALAVGFVPAIDTGRPLPWQSRALAGAPQDAEKLAFEEAKALGTVEAWDAFLSHYPSGFHADLARAYVKKLAAEPQTSSPPAGPTVSANDDFPVAAASWGGVLRDGPGQNFCKVGSLQEGEPVTLMARTDVFEGDFPWFKIAFKDGKIGYQWGGILCSTGPSGRTSSRRARSNRQARAGRRRPSQRRRRSRRSGAPRANISIRMGAASRTRPAVRRGS